MVDVARLHERGRQALLHRPERRAAVGRGLRGPQLRVRRAAPRAASGARGRSRSSTRTIPGSPTAASRTTTTSSSTTWGRTCTSAGGQSTDEDGEPAADGRRRRPLGGLTWSFDGTGAGNQANSATFPVTSTILDPARFPHVRQLAQHRQLAAPGRGAVRPVQRHQVLPPRARTTRPTSGCTRTLDRARGRDRVAVVQDRRTTSRTTTTTCSSRWSSSITGEPVDSTWTTLPDADGHATQEVGLSCPSTGDGSNWRSNHPFIDHYQTVTDNGDDCAPGGHVGRLVAAPPARPAAGSDWTTDLSAYAGKSIRVNHHGRHGLRRASGLGVWVDDAKLIVNGATVDETSFEDGARQAGPPARRPRARSRSENGWQSSETSFIEGGVVATDDSVYTGFGFEGIERGRPAGVHAARDGAPRRAGQAGRSGQPRQPREPREPGRPEAGKVRIKSKRKLRLDRKGRVAVRLTCAGDDRRALQRQRAAHPTRQDRRMPSSSRSAPAGPRASR